MTMPFDPYYSLLGIPPQEQPPTYYRLLNLPPLTNDAGLIGQAADLTQRRLFSFLSGPYAAYAQPLIGEVAMAAGTLLNPQSKEFYDRQISAAYYQPQAQPQQVIAVDYEEIETLLPDESPNTFASPLPQAQPLSHNTPIQSMQPIQVSAAGTRSSGSAKRASKNEMNAAAGQMVQIIGGGAGGILVGILVIWYVFRSDPFGLFQDDKAVAEVPPAKPAVVRPTAGDGRTPGTGAPPTQPATLEEKSKDDNETAANDANGGTSPAQSTEPGEVSGADPVPSNPVQPPKANPATPANPPGPNNVGQNPPGQTLTIRIVPKGNGQSADPQNPNPPFNPGPNNNRPGMPAVPNNEPPAVAKPASPKPRAEKVPAPSADEQKLKLAAVMEIYKEEFENATKPAGRATFPQWLIDAAEKIKDDPAARFVLNKEAYTRLITNKDFYLAAEVVDRLEADYIMDPFKLRSHLITQMSQNAKSNIDKVHVVTLAGEMAEAAVKAGRFSEGLAYARMGEAAAKSLNDKATALKLNSRSREIDKMVEGFGPVKTAREKLAANPDDPAAKLVDGRFRCLFEGDWNLGLTSLMDGGDEDLKAAAIADLRGAEIPMTPAMLGDLWWAIGKRDVASNGFLVRAEYWYKQAVGRATGLEGARLEQRLREIESLGLNRPLPTQASANLPTLAVMLQRSQKFPEVNVLQASADGLSRGVITGSALWTFSSNRTTVTSEANGISFLPSPVAPPTRSYRVTVAAQKYSTFAVDPNRAGDRIAGIAVGLVGPSGMFAAVVDERVPGRGYACYLTTKNTATSADCIGYVSDVSPYLLRGSRILEDGTRQSGSTIISEVTRDRVTVQVNGRTVIDCQPDWNRLGSGNTPKNGADQGGRPTRPNQEPKSLFLASSYESYLVSQWELAPAKLPAEPAQPEVQGGFFNR